MEEPGEHRAPASLHGWIDRVVIPQRHRSRVLPIGAICTAFGLCFGATTLFGSGSVTATWYVPAILVAAARFRYVGVLVASAVATLLSGPLRPLDAGDLPQRSVVWIGRGVVFVLVGLFTAALIDRILADRERELGLAEQERDLAVRQAAVVATVSHEFRTPLTVITGVARTLEVHGMISSDGEPLLRGLMDAARRLTDLVNTVGAVMDGSDSGTFVRREPIVARDVLDGVLDRVGVGGSRRRVSVEVDPNAEVFISDRDLLGQLLRHVIENAVKFSPSDEPVQVHVSRAAGRLEVRVRDRGPGISQALLQSPLPFTQGDQSMTRTAQGLGLGLFAAARLAAVLEGSIRFLPRPGGGTEVVVTVAAPDASEPMADDMARTAID